MLATISYIWKEQIRLIPLIKRAGGLEIGVDIWEQLSPDSSSYSVEFPGIPAFGCFVLIILTIELWKFCTSHTEENLEEYLIWLLMFAPWLYLFSSAYREGPDFQHMSLR